MVFHRCLSIGPLISPPPLPPTPPLKRSHHSQLFSKNLNIQACIRNLSVMCPQLHPQTPTIMCAVTHAQTVRCGGVLVCVRVLTSVSVCVSIWVCVSGWVCVSVWVCVCMHPPPTYRPGERERGTRLGVCMCVRACGWVVEGGWGLGAGVRCVGVGGWVSLFGN